MIHIPMICRRAINVATAPSLSRLFVKAATNVLRDLAVALGEHNASDPGVVVIHGNSMSVTLTFGSAVLMIIRQTNTQTDFGAISDVFITCKTVAGSSTTTSVEKLATAAQQLHFINAVRSKRNIAAWSMKEFLCRNLSRLGQAA